MILFGKVLDSLEEMSWKVPFSIGLTKFKVVLEHRLRTGLYTSTAAYFGQC